MDRRVRARLSGTKTCRTLSDSAGQSSSETHEQTHPDRKAAGRDGRAPQAERAGARVSLQAAASPEHGRDRKSTRLNSSHRCISYAVFCLKKKKIHRVVDGVANRRI